MADQATIEAIRLRLAGWFDKSEIRASRPNDSGDVNFRIRASDGGKRRVRIPGEGFNDYQTIEEILPSGAKGRIEEAKGLIAIIHGAAVRFEPDPEG